MRTLPDPSSYWSEDDGRRVVEAWRRSNESAVAFARRHGLQAKRLAYWSKRLATSQSAAIDPAPTVTFVPAAVTTADEVAAVIRAPGGITIELMSASPAQIAAVANALVRSLP
jgi:transposase-like protein